MYADGQKIVAKKVFRPFQNSNFCLLYFGFFAAETVFWSFLWMIFVNLVEIDNFIKLFSVVVFGDGF